MGSFSNFAGFDAAGTHQNPSSCTVSNNRSQALKIREEAPTGNAGDFLSNAALFLGHTSARDRVTAHGALSANVAKLHFKLRVKD